MSHPLPTTPAHRANSDLPSAVSAAEERFIAANPKSMRRAEEAARSLPGGNTRTVLHYTPFPVTIVSGEGAVLTDLDGHLYTDFLGEFTAGLYGHSNPILKKAISEALASGVVLGGPNPYEAQLSALICERFPSLDRVRFCNSGTEANLYAVSAARLFTGRDKVLVFRGGYHGGVFYFGEPLSPINAPFDFIVGRYNDIDGTGKLIEKEGKALAAILVEPMLGSGGAIPARRDFLQMLRDKAEQHGIVLIFDEVMTSRLAPGGLQEHHEVTPHMTALGKYLGGGMTFGAFGGRQDIMRRFNPYEADAVSHAGTFNNNVLSMAAGLTGLRDIYTPEAAQGLNAIGESLKADINRRAKKHGIPFQVTGTGSILAFHFQSGAIACAEDTWPHSAAERERLEGLRKLLHLDLLSAGFYVARRGFLSLSLPLTEDDYRAFADAVEEFMVVREPILSADAATVQI
ncbi:MAG: aminotransferase class III-fold pyridoxal phosphate-dependent enzyme [Pseudomonadota bacterium]